MYRYANQLFNQSILAEVSTLKKQDKKKLLVFENTNIEENLWSNSGEWKVANKEEKGIETQTCKRLRQLGNVQRRGEHKIGKRVWTEDQMGRDVQEDQGCDGQIKFGSLGETWFRTRNG